MQISDVQMPAKRLCDAFVGLSPTTFSTSDKSAGVMHGGVLVTTL